MASSPGAGAQNKEVVFDLDAAAFSSNHFRMHEFKVRVAVVGRAVGCWLHRRSRSMPCWIARGHALFISECGFCGRVFA